jgi:hypothetical protein
LARLLHKTALMRDYLGMEPTVSDPRGAGDGEQARLAAEPSHQAALTHPAGDPPAGKVSQAPARSIASGITATLARLPGARPGQVARGISGTIGRRPGPRRAPNARGIVGAVGRQPAAAPGRPARGAAGATSRLQWLRPGRLAGGPSRLQWLRPGRLAGGPSRLRSTLPGRLAIGTARKAEGFWRRHPLEATSLTLLALGGLAYPFPFWWLDFLVWLIGAAVAAWSQLWDLRDKWAALAGPVALVIVGTAATLAFGGARVTMAGYVHEALAGSLYLIKTGSLLGVVYLAWRVRRGRRSPSVPPWLRKPPA